MSFASPVTPGSAAAPALGPKSRGVRRVGRATPVPTRLPLLARMQLGVERRAHGREAARGTRRPTQAPDVGAVTIPVAARPERVTREWLRAGDPRAKLPLPEPLASTLPSSSGPGRGPLKAETRVRLPLGAPGSPLRDVGRPAALTAEGAWPGARVRVRVPGLRVRRPGPGAPRHHRDRGDRHRLPARGARGLAEVERRARAR